MLNKPTPKKSDQRETRQPTYRAFHVVEGVNGKENRWNRIGAFWPHQNGDGGTLVLEYIPVNFDGRIVLRAPKPTEALNQCRGASASNPRLPAYTRRVESPTQRAWGSASRRRCSSARSSRLPGQPAEADRHREQKPQHAGDQPQQQGGVQGLPELGAVVAPPGKVHVRAPVSWRASSVRSGDRNG